MPSVLLCSFSLVHSLSHLLPFLPLPSPLCLCLLLTLPLSLSFFLSLTRFLSWGSSIGQHKPRCNAPFHSVCHTMSASLPTLTPHTHLAPVPEHQFSSTPCNQPPEGTQHIHMYLPGYIKTQAAFEWRKRDNQAGKAHMKYDKNQH